MSKKIGLQAKLFAAFLLMALLVFIVGWVGQSGSSQLSGYLHEISEVRLPSIVGLQMMDRGFSVLRSGQIALLNPRLTDSLRREQIQQIQEAEKQIQAGYKKYDPLPRTVNEDKLWQSFRSEWKRWQQKDEEFSRMYQKFQQLGINNPYSIQLELYKKDQVNSPLMAKAVTASVLLEKMNQQIFTVNKTAFNSLEKELQKVIKENEAIAEAQKQAADQNVAQTQFWALLGMFGGSAIAIILGIILSLAIAKPLDKAIRSIINTLVSSSTQMLATVQQQEAIASKQAAAVHETTTTIDQLKTSSKGAQEQANAVAKEANQVLSLAQTGTLTLEQTTEDITMLKNTVEALSEKIQILNQQTSQIGNISLIVSELANQTNMLALNAAVEAIRASEQGKGFSVIATEIRRLADQSKQSATQINNLVVNIQKAIDSTVIEMDEGKIRMEKGVKTAQQTAAAFQVVNQAIENIVACNQQIALTAKEQALAIQQVVDAMNAINTGAQENAIGISQTKLTTENLNQVAFKLKAVI
ncbi:methyl-accepting chemotaxis protein [Aerosakkonemataceae cyanobacterium BLCC-F154]|uniref:Methyl-accepting chemotaxis protein n=1 Tax=Floridaenema fluviatile BLCC-F154 TaxID=3153640 RepID=A0ABV4YHX7_9CYAN